MATTLVRPAAPVRTKAARPVARKVLRPVSLYVACLLVAFLTVFPFLWMVSTSFKEPTEAVVLPPKWIPDPFTWQNYKELFTSPILPFTRFIWNSTKITVLVVIG